MSAVPVRLKTKTNTRTCSFVYWSIISISLDTDVSLCFVTLMCHLLLFCSDFPTYCLLLMNLPCRKRFCQQLHIVKPPTFRSVIYPTLHQQHLTDNSHESHRVQRCHCTQASCWQAHMKTGWTCSQLEIQHTRWRIFKKVIYKCLITLHYLINAIYIWSVCKSCSTYPLILSNSSLCWNLWPLLLLSFGFFFSQDDLMAVKNRSTECSCTWMTRWISYAIMQKAKICCGPIYPLWSVFDNQSDKNTSKENCVTYFDLLRSSSSM